jgi:hypothetical protein
VEAEAPGEPSPGGEGGLVRKKTTRSVPS